MPRLEQLEAEMHRNGRVVIRTSRWKVALLVPLAVTFLALGLACTFGPDVPIHIRLIGIMITVVFGALFVVSIRRLATGRPQIVVDHQGITVESRHAEWSEISGFFVTTVRLSSFVGVLGRGGAAPLAKESHPLTQWLVRKSGATLPTALTLRPRRLAKFLEGQLDLHR